MSCEILYFCTEGQCVLSEKTWHQYSAGLLSGYCQEGCKGMAEEREGTEALGTPPRSGWARMVVELHVNNLEARLWFWRGVLGFETSFERSEERFVYLEHPEGHQIMLCQRHGRFETGPLDFPLGQGAMFQIYFESFYAKNGKLKYCYNVAGVHYFYVEAARPLPAGEHQVRMEFAYAGGGLGKGGQVTLYVDGEKVGEGAIPMTQAMVFSADDGCDVGEDSGAPVSQDYGSRGNAFNGTIKGVQLAIGEAAESSDHLVSPEEAVRIAMARQ